MGDGYDIRTIPELLGHKDVSAAIYTRLLNLVAARKFLARLIHCRHRC
jgi:site-specific recombinase XerD